MWEKSRREFRNSIGYRKKRRRPPCHLKECLFQCKRKTFFIRFSFVGNINLFLEIFFFLLFGRFFFFSAPLIKHFPSSDCCFPLYATAFHFIFPHVIVFVVFDAAASPGAFDALEELLCVERFLIILLILIFISCFQIIFLEKRERSLLVVYCLSSEFRQTSSLQSLLRGEWH